MLLLSNALHDNDLSCIVFRLEVCSISLAPRLRKVSSLGEIS